MCGLVESAPPHLFVVHRAILAAAVLLAVLPASAAAGVRIEMREAAIPALRASAALPQQLPVQRAPFRFNLVGIHWQGPGDVSFRTATAAGPWSAWREARPEAEDAPDPGTSEGASTRGWKLGNPYWTGPADRIQYRASGRVGRIRAFFLSSPVRRTVGAAKVMRVAQPAIILRKAWGANESIVRDKPSYADRVAFSVVHHTAGTQPSSPAQSAAIVRGIQAYHVKGNGWDDIGYNFLVDRFGQIFEGRGGGITANVIGAHAQGFNTGSAGVAVLGTFSGSAIPAGARRALVSLLAWRLDLAHVNPTSKLVWRSMGNPEFPEGRAVRLRAVSGHRDTGPTSCPGARLYRQLRGIARSTRAHGGTKIFAPRAKGPFGGPIRIRGWVEPARAWRVIVQDGTGATVASGRGTGARVDWTWNSAGAPAGVHRWVIFAGNALPATGLVGSGGTPPPGPGEVLELVSASVSPPVLSPNGDRRADRARLAWETSLPAQVRILIRNESGQVVGRAYPWTHLPAGRTRVTWNGGRLGGGPLADGRYTLDFVARAGASVVRRSARVLLDRTLGALRVSPRAFSPNGDGRRDTTSAAFALVRPARVVTKVWRRAGPSGMVFVSQMAAGEQTVPWDGRLGGTTVPDGVYRLTVLATTDFGTRRLRRWVRVDTRNPRLTEVMARRTPRGTRIRFTLDERGPVVVRLGTVVARINGVVGRNRVWRRLHVDQVTVRSWDRAGNRSRLARVSVH
jgi:N-acetylmuramoyl-L-alanine amidase/FlgD Ig-like domain